MIKEKEMTKIPAMKGKRGIHTQDYKELSKTPRIQIEGSMENAPKSRGTPKQYDCSLGKIPNKNPKKA